MKKALLMVLALTLASLLTAAAEEAKKDSADKTAAKPAASRQAADELAELLYADKVYKANCARCHQAPDNLEARKMATVLRHMRVRANLPQKEYRALLRYLAQPKPEKKN